MSTTVAGPDGGTWVVRRRWLPGTSTRSLWSRFRARFLRVGRRARDSADLDPGCLELFGEGVAAAVALVVLLLLVVFVLLPLVVALVEVVALLVVAGAILLARVVLRRPWIVEAIGPDAQAVRWDVVGWRASGEACAAIARHLEAGIVPPPGIVPT